MVLLRNTSAGRSLVKPNYPPLVPINAQITLACFLFCCSDCSRSQPAGGNRERPDAAGPERSGEGLPSDQPEARPADGRPGGTQRPGHHIGYSARAAFGH